MDDGVLVPLRPARQPGWVHAGLLRRHPEQTDEWAYFLVYALQDTLLAEVIRAVGARWNRLSIVQRAPGQVGLDHDEGRSWWGWYRPSTHRHQAKD